MAEKKKMDKMTKGFLIFMASAFIILTIIGVFGNRSYELKGIAKGPNTQQGSIKNTGGSASPEFQPYLEEMHKQISGKWNPPPVNKDAEVVLRFTIQKNGHVINEEVSQSSGSKELDDSALAALRRSSPLPPLPLSFPRDEVTVNFNFKVKANQY